MKDPEFYTYILTNWNKTVLYVGYTQNLSRRLLEDWIGKDGSFTTKYKVYYLVWYNVTKYVLNAINFEKEIKSWSRAKKIILINEMNPEWHFLNESLLGNWPPTEEQL